MGGAKTVALGAALAGGYAYAKLKPDPRFSRQLEYQLIEACVGQSSYPDLKLQVCTCALQKTQLNGPPPDYDNDQDYYEDRREFTEKFERNIRNYSEDTKKKLGSKRC